MRTSATLCGVAAVLLCALGCCASGESRFVSPGEKFRFPLGSLDRWNFRLGHWGLEVF